MYTVNFNYNCAVELTVQPVHDMTSMRAKENGGVKKMEGKSRTHLGHVGGLLFSLLRCT